MKTVVFVILLFSTVILSLNLPKVDMTPVQREIVETALSMVGGRYGWGAYDPQNRTFDCWNFVTWVYHHVLDKDGGVKHMLIGIDDPLWVFFKDLKDLRPADVLSNGGEHTVGFHAGIYYGGGYTIEARGGNYGIGVFRIEGRNPHCPLGETGYRFCYYSLLARLWLDHNPDFPYVYVKTHQSFFVSEDGIELELHAYSPESTTVTLKIEAIDYLKGETISTWKAENVRLSPPEKVEKVVLRVENFSGYVYLKVDMIDSRGRIIFTYDTRIKGPLEII